MSTGPHSPTRRSSSVDAYRGFVMLAMASGGAAIFGNLARSSDPSTASVISVLAGQLDHVAWRGCCFWDLIQPSFMFLVGVAMPFSYANRRDRGESRRRLLGHAVVRSLILVALAVFLSSTDSRRTNFVFVNVLAQIGMGYTFVYLLLDRRPREQFAVAFAILAAYWLMFVLHPFEQGAYSPGVPAPGNDGTTFAGFFDHWSKNRNAAAAFDRWFLNLFPRPEGRPFVANDGGYATLNFVPSIATMLFGVLVGELLRSPRSAGQKLRTLLVAGAMGLAVGAALDQTVCPIVKRIWTPSWAIYSAGWCCLMTAAFFSLIDMAGYRRWAFPLVVVGMNSIVLYVMAQLMKPFVRRSLAIHLGPELFSGPWGPMRLGLGVLLVFWLICYWFYRRGIFVRI
jgi:predicted acyltransferase